MIDGEGDEIGDEKTKEKWLWNRWKKIRKLKMRDKRE